MAFQFNQPAQSTAQPQGISSLPAQSSAQGGFTFQPQAALQHPNTLPTAQPLTNQQLGINPQAQQTNQAAQFAQSMAAWEAARQAELAGIKPTTNAINPNSGLGHWSMAGWVPDNTQYGIGMGTHGIADEGGVGGIGGMPYFNRNKTPVTPVTPTYTPFTIAPIPTDPQQYNTYIAQQQAAFEAAKKARGG